MALKASGKPILELTEIVSELENSQIMRLCFSLPFWGMCGTGQRLLSRIYPGLSGLHSAGNQVDGILP